MNIFKKKPVAADRYYEGFSMGEAKAYTRIKNIIDEYCDGQYYDHHGILTAIKAICEYELRDNPYRRNVILFKSKEKEL